MDLAETMKAALSSSKPGGGASGNHPSGMNSNHTGAQGQDQGVGAGAGYVTEKLYMLLQLYLQNKGWNPSVELLQCFSELKDSALLPNAAYLQVLANRLALDSQGRLVLRDTGKIVLPFEHFANAVMLKHMSGPHGLHLSLEATVRAVMDSYTIGRENFGMEKEFIVEVVQSCPNPACRFYKNHLGTPYIDQQFPGPGMNPEFLTHMSQMASTGGASGTTDLPGMEKGTSGGAAAQSVVAQAAAAAAAKHAKQSQSQHQQQITAAIIQQQNRAIAQQSLEKFGNMTALEKQRVLQQLDKKHYDAVQQQVAAAANICPPPPNVPAVSGSSSINVPSSSKRRSNASADNKFLGMMQNNPANVGNAGGGGGSGGGMMGQQVLNMSTSAQNHLPPPPPPQGQQQGVQHQSTGQQGQQQTSSGGGGGMEHNQQAHKDFLRSNLDCLETLTSNKDLLALHNGAWTNQEGRDGLAIGQDKIVRAFAELMRNMARMKTFIRPSMCKPYGKQSESLQKTLIDTIQLVQSLRNCLPAPHIPVSSWKSEDRHRREPDLGNYES
ncbi:uncharacterized protein LOC129791450 [Lutzomyia longipalpis]|uniref:uncharacterized protein LOC129791450 n=1 Tax=Lutzomyia longipalpis TaxID=7200 RepID=UPI002483B09A|nr:uncharacterized protein LOC129791450 [Lutzomyia longipalpis]XP_055685609.1 uncharacterized protein LOC129791450 [Lutzomyia longipalpis]